MSIDYRSRENGKRMSRSEGSSFTETGSETNMRVSYLMMCLMARERQHLYAEMSTRDIIKMALRTGLANTLGMMGKYMMAPGSRIRCMELESLDAPMGRFTKEALQIP